MKTKHIILITLLIPVFFVIAWYALKLKPLPEYGSSSPYHASEFSVYGEDGTLLPGEMLLPESSDSRAFIISADQKLDRSWNSRNMDFKIGRIISNILAGNNIPVAIYDQRGSGESILSGRNHPTPENLASDFNIVLEKIKQNENFRDKNLEIIAHGHGCIPALIAVNKYKIPVKRIYLLSCVFPGTLLDSWLTQILNNMERAGVEKPSLQKAKEITEKWKRQKEFKLLQPHETNAEKNSDQDIQSLYSALDYMQKEQMHAWTVQARDISFLDELNRLDSSIEIYHILNEFDEEFAENLVVSWEKTINTGEFKIEKNRYVFKIIPATDHFFMHTASPSRGVIRLILQRINPFREMDRNLFEYIFNYRASIK